MYAMTPALRAGINYLNSSIYAELVGREITLPVFSTNGGPAHKNPLHIADGNPKTFWSSDQRMKEGDWYCIDFRQPTDIRNITLLMGGPRTGDFPKAGVFEVSDDGEEWHLISEEPKGGAAIVVNLMDAPVQARMLRYRITQPNPRWMSICEFTVNRGLPTYATTNISKCAKLGAFADSEYAGINRIMEVFPIAPGEFISLEFPTPVFPQWVEINLENASLNTWGSIELTLADGSKKAISAPIVKNRIFIEKEDLPQEKISALRVTNISNKAEEIKLTLFRVGIPEIEPDQTPYTLVDADLSTFYNCGKSALNVQIPLPKNTFKICVIGTADASVNGDTGTQISDHIREYSVPQGVNRINLYAPQNPGARVYEILFLHE